jgi:predicted amidophosphoribosyltransferase
MASMSSVGPHVCPGCGERVSAFAAGCALCGADLDPRRGQRSLTVIERLRRHLTGLPGGRLRQNAGYRS